MNIPHLVVGDAAGNFYEVPELYMAGVGFIKPLLPGQKDLLALTDKSALQVLPGRVAIGYDPDLEKYIQLREYNGTAVFPVAAALPQHQLQIYRSAFSMVLDAPRLPGKNYTATGMRGGAFFAAATEISQTAEKQRSYTFVNNLSEADPATLIQSAAATSDPALVIANAHGDNETLLPDFIKSIRSLNGDISVYVQTPNLSPSLASTLCNAGVSGLWVSTNSFQEDYFNKLHEPSGSKFESLKASIKTMQDCGGETILDYQVFPGLTDHPREIDAMDTFLSNAAITTLHLSNLAIDPEWYMDELMILALPRDQIGISGWLESLHARYPELLSAVATLSQ